MTSQIVEKPILVQNSGYRSAMWKLEASSAHTLKMDFAVKKRIRGHYTISVPEYVRGGDL